MRKFLWLVPILGLLLVLAAGCTAAPAPAASTGDAAPQAASGEPITVRVSTIAEPSTLDPNLAEDTYSITPIEQLFLGLTNLNNETGVPEPELAESWTVSDDGLTWTFNLRKDAVWSDGNPVTAKDVEYSVKRAVKPETASPYAYVLYLIKNAQAINQTVLPTDTYDIDTLGVKAVDDYTVQFELEAPAAYFESISSMWTLRPVPSWVIEEFGDAWTDPANIVVNGPYLLKEWKPAEQLVFEKNPTYFKKDDVQIDRVELDVISDQNTELALYESGDIDVAGDNAGSFPIEALTRIRSDATLSAELHEGPRASTTYVGFTMTKPPFDNVLVRKAFSAAIDRATMVKDVVGTGVPATQFAPKGIFGAPDPEVGIASDVEQAKAWLAEAGYPDGEGFPTVTYRYFSSTLEEALAQALQAMWKENLNVDVQLESMEFPAFLASTAATVPVEEMPEMWRLGWGADYPDENNWVYEVFHCTDSQNRPCAECTEADELAKAAGRETDSAKRIEMYRQVEEMMFGDEVRVAPYYHRGFTILAKPYIERAYPAFAPPNWDTWRVNQ
ncbi:MAG: peptide ABC transporter substrate-binding protein [Anaerolineales bacterium]|nr:peptide ABC transporter substrate-binding protein [Anaerolineales bacterium]